MKGTGRNSKAPFTLAVSVLQFFHTVDTRPQHDSPIQRPKPKDKTDCDKTKHSSLNHRMKVLSIAAILLAFSPVPGVAQHYSASMDLRNSYTLDGTRRMTEYFLEVQRQHCSGKNARLAGENAAHKQRLAALAPRISSLLHLNRKRTAAKEGDAAAKALDARLAKEQTETFTKLSSGYAPRGEVSLKACIAESARMAGMLADFEESVVSIEENSRR